MSGTDFISALALRLRKTFTSRKDKNSAAFYLQQLSESLGDYKSKLAASEKNLEAARDSLDAAKHIDARISLAIDEMRWPKGASNRRETPHAVILSPYQFEKVNSLWFPSRNAKREIHGLPIYIASGLYGPLVVTQTALDGLSRQAPELNIRKA